jgi:hypothetical protein
MTNSPRIPSEAGSCIQAQAEIISAVRAEMKIATHWALKHTICRATYCIFIDLHEHHAAFRHLNPYRHGIYFRDRGVAFHLVVQGAFEAFPKVAIISSSNEHYSRV